MSLFRRREPLHVRLAREGGVPLGEAQPVEPARPAWDAAGIHGLQRLRQWDAVGTIVAPGIEGDHARFVALSRDELLVEEGPDGLDPIAAAVETALQPPYRAEATRRDGDRWAYAARRIELVTLPGTAGSEIELSESDGVRTLLVDGEPGFGSVPGLERPGHVVRAKRLSGDTWEVTFDRL